MGWRLDAHSINAMSNNNTHYVIVLSHEQKSYTVKPENVRVREGISE
jgi:hypothetical protein